jgi:hypothetical protein
MVKQSRRALRTIDTRVRNPDAGETSARESSGRFIPDNAGLPFVLILPPTTSLDAIHDNLGVLSTVGATSGPAPALAIPSQASSPPTY